MSTIVDILTFMSMTSFMNVLRLICRADGCLNANNFWYFNIYEHDKFHECFKIDIVAYAVNMSRLKILLQIFYKHSNYVTA